MRRILVILTLLFSFWEMNAQDMSLMYKGQVSTYAHYYSSNTGSFLIGGRYLPQLNLGLDLGEKGLVDFETSLNVYGNTPLDFSETTLQSGDIKPYRAWVRYSNSQLEIRAGLQKINFGSANMLRPLMWFDQIDARDPLKLTDGVWGLLGRYYFLNNANVWLWGLYGNKNPKGWEVLSSDTKIPELGGRLQFPLSLGEAGLTYHHRRLEPLDGLYSIYGEGKVVNENKYGLDVRLDWALGSWFEASLTTKDANIGILTNQAVFNLGFDYTLGVGSGLYMAFEQLLMTYDEELLSFHNPVFFSLFSASYPLGLSDNISTIVYYDWSQNQAYRFINYQKQLNNLSLFVMAYWNPETFSVPTQSSEGNFFGGKGIQLMLVWNH